MFNMQKIIEGNPLRLHSVFCLVVLMPLLGLIYFYTGSLSVRDLTTCMFFLLCVYAGRWLCREWYLRNQYGLFSLFSLLVCVAVLVSWWLIVKYLFHHPYAELHELSAFNGPFFIMGLVIGMLMKLITASVRKQLQDARTAAEQKQTELSLLQSQLSPHFLFNTLNNMYSISIVQHELVPELLLKLSELLRYTVYNTREPLLPVSQELAYIHNYVDFEKIRIGDRLMLHMDVAPVTGSGIAIPPRLLIVCIESAFKHARDTLKEKIYIAITLKIEGEHILFSVVNSHNGEVQVQQRFPERSGMGLSNTIRRLNLLYADDYELKQSDEGGLYTVQLRLRIKRTHT